jgi:hypothetical protein
MDSRMRQDAAWNAWAEHHVQRAIDAEREFTHEVLAEVIALERQAMRDHVAEEIGALRADVTVQRAWSTKPRVRVPAGSRHV